MPFRNRDHSAPDMFDTCAIDRSPRSRCGRVTDSTSWRSLAPLQKLQLSQELRRTAWLLKEAWIRAQHPALSPAEVEARVRQLFLDAGS